MSSESERAELAAAHQVDCFEEGWVRLAIRVEQSRKPLLFVDHLPKLGANVEEVTRDRCRDEPWVAFVILRCPICKVRAHVAGRGRTARKAADACVAEVAAHGLTCEEKKDG